MPEMKIARSGLDWHQHVSDLRRQVEHLRDLRTDYRKQIRDIQRAVMALGEILPRSSMYKNIRRGLSRAVLSLDGDDPRTTSFLTQLDYLTGQYDKIRMASRVAARHMRAGTRLYHLSPAVTPYTYEG